VDIEGVVPPDVILEKIQETLAAGTELDKGEVVE